MCTEKPNDETHGNIWTPAKRVGVSRTAVNTMVREYGLKPHLAGTFQMSNDPDFEKELKAVVRLYVNLPEHAIIFV